MNRKISALLLTMLAATGCSTHVDQPSKVMVTVSAGVNGAPWPVITAPAALNVPSKPIRMLVSQFRECNADKTECVLGVPKIVAVVNLVELGQEDVHAQLELDYTVGREQTLTTTGDKNASYHTTRALTSDNVPSVLESSHISKRVKLKYEGVGIIRLPHGLAFSICIAAPTEAEQRQGSECNGPKVNL